MTGCKSVEETMPKFTLMDCFSRFLAFIYKKPITSQAKINPVLILLQWMSFQKKNFNTEEGKNKMTRKFLNYFMRLRFFIFDCDRINFRCPVFFLVLLVSWLAINVQSRKIFEHGVVYRDENWRVRCLISLKIKCNFHIAYDLPLF